MGILEKIDYFDLPESDQAKAGLGGDETDLLAGVQAPCEGLSPRAQVQVSTADRLLETRIDAASVDVTVTTVDGRVEGGVLCGDARTCLPTTSPVPYIIGDVSRSDCLQPPAVPTGTQAH